MNLRVKLRGACPLTKWVSDKGRTRGPKLGDQKRHFGLRESFEKKKMSC